MEEILRRGLAELGIGADEGRLSSFRRYYEYLMERNSVMNLTAIEGEEEAARLHFLDCCALLALCDFRGKRVIDVGAGAGFPGLPLRIAEPGISLTLLDSLGKRVDFLRAACAELGLEGVETVCARAEEAPAELRESFDIATARAVANLRQLVEYCLPFVKVGGVFLPMKAGDIEAELGEAKNAVGTLGGRLERVYSYTLPGEGAVMSVPVIRKVRKTDAKYPRRQAQIVKKPL